MYKFSILILLFFCSYLKANSDTSSSCIKKEIRNLRILTWNVQMLPKITRHNKKTADIHSKREDWVYEYLGQNEFDIILLQECFYKKFVSKLSTKLKQKYPYQLKPKKKSIFKFSNGLMILSKYPIIDSQFIFFSHAKGVDKLVSKGAVKAKINIRDSFDIEFINTHMQSDYEDKCYAKIRSNQIDEIYEKFLCISRPKFANIVLGGDINIAENNSGLEFNSFKNKLKLCDIETNDTDCNLMSFNKDNFWNQEIPSSVRYDYILSNFKTTKSNTTILKPKKYFNQQLIDLADHYPILVDFELNSRN